MNRAHRLLLPDPAARERLRRECEEDLAVWVAASGAAVRIPFPQKEEPRDEA